ncbi:MAG: DegV family protein [Anaerolineae bacterium]|nr:DegV family protein [Anaerolineae bacterium]MDW8070062.1 DegV family protein [Anaerolineae bacterium]
MIAVVTDTCASIPQHLVEALQIEIVPYYIHREGETLRDMIDISPEEFYRWLPSAQRLPTTANPGPGDYLQAFERAAQRASGIVSIHMTSKGSGAYQAGCVAREMAEARIPGVRIEVIDTLQVSGVHALAAIEAANVALQGGSLEKVAEAARYVARSGLMLQAFDTLRYLYLGGRIGKAKHLVGTLLNIKPIVSMADGIVVPMGQARSIEQAYQKMIDMMADNGAGKGPIKVMITHNAAPDRAATLRELVTRTFDCREMYITQTSPALGVHTGPGMIGVSYFPIRAGA